MDKQTALICGPCYRVEVRVKVWSSISQMNEGLVKFTWKIPRSASISLYIIATPPERDGVPGGESGRMQVLCFLRRGHTRGGWGEGLGVRFVFESRGVERGETLSSFEKTLIEPNAGLGVSGYLGCCTKPWCPCGR